MNKGNYYIMPGIQWKITGLEREKFCNIKGPEFSLAGTTCKLKLKFTQILNSIKCSIWLKRKSIETKFSEIETSARICNGRDTYYLYTNYMQDSMTACLVWEMLSTEISMSFKDLFDNCYFCLNTRICTFSSANPFAERHREAGMSFPCLTSLCLDFENFICNQSSCDVILECAEKKIYAHRVILAARSEYFAKLFQDEMKDSKQHVYIGNMESSIFEQLIRYMYSGCAECSDESTARKLYAAADKYGIYALKLRCGTFMCENENNSNENGVASSNCIAQTGKQDENNVECISRRFGNIQDVLKTSEWKKLSKDDPTFAYKTLQSMMKAIV